MEYLIGAILFLFGGLVGGIATYFIVRANQNSGLRDTLQEVQTERTILFERLQVREASLQESRQTSEQREARLSQLQGRITELTSQLTEATTLLNEEREHSQEQLQTFNQAQQRLTDAFKALAADALHHNNTSFLELAKSALERLQVDARGDLDKRQTAISELVKPVHDSLAKVDHHIKELETAREGAYAALREQVHMMSQSHVQLRSETSNLVKALRAPHVRGRWGEMQLRQAVELAGMVEYCDFEEQKQFGAGDGSQRPDLIVRLPAGRSVIVDAKVPLTAFLEGIEAQSDDDRVEKLKEHARHIREHVQQLSKKSYWEQLPSSPDFVVMFLPGESLFSSALQHDPSLIDFGAKQRVILATPTTLITLLKAVACGWREDRLAKNAQEICTLGRELYKRLSTLAGHFSRVGESLAKAVTHYNQAVGSLEARVLTSARKFKELSAADDEDQINEIQPVELNPRPLQSPELNLEGDHPPRRVIARFAGPE